MRQFLAHNSAINLAESSGALSRIVRLQQARADGEWVQSGCYAQPVIACCDRPEHFLVQRETMSPLLVLQRTKDFNHALELCNGVTQGLIASLFSNKRELREQFLSDARAGVLKFNASTAGVDIALPFGGWKASGVGPPEHGDGDVQFYTRAQAVYGATEL